MTSPIEEIASLESDIERLTEAAERCRKTAIVAQLVAGAGGLILTLMIVGILRLSPEVLVMTIAAVLGGIALRGTNQSTHDEIRSEITKAEVRRAALIDLLQLQRVDSLDTE